MSLIASFVNEMADAVSGNLQSADPFLRSRLAITDRAVTNGLSKLSIRDCYCGGLRQLFHFLTDALKYRFQVADIFIE